MIICISTLRWMSSRWEMNTKFFRPVIGQIDVRRIERLFVKKKRRVISKYLLSEECVLSLWLWLWDWERRQKQFESILLQNWPCLDAHYAFFHRGNHSCACNARCSISQPLIPDWCSFCTSQNFDLFSSLFFFLRFPHWEKETMNFEWTVRDLMVRADVNLQVVYERINKCH